MSVPAFYAELRELRLERLLDASVEIVAEAGWDALSMTEVSKRSGVPRQSIYKEVGTKADLGRAVVDREVGRSLALTGEELAARPDLESGLPAGLVARFARSSTRGASEAEHEDQRRLRGRAPAAGTVNARRRSSWSCRRPAPRC